ncbi:serine/threonine-protein kinase/endoribonuclease IRE1 [Daphnia magna]|uniref:Protein kinase domain-containing protein n=2 Tax=Daphnia magna TaxID=35525 RepID=A0ABR0B474_9CRUS|nr:serine/threonine-protein kinase/endoribonuclease IRE1 [Daphnia magna]KAK4036503.1 hypothetical protein OUZ56_028556 [Daphnia magna]
MAAKVGDIEFDRRQIIGWGPNGTVVLRGRLNGAQQPVAVKRYLTKQLKWNASEFELYRKEDHHNILRLYDVTSDQSGFTYLALELCVCNLADYLAGKYRGPTLSSRNILLQTTQGVEHLHSLGIVHRGLKPNNVLINWPNDECDDIQIKLSDFGVMANSSGDSWPCGDMASVEGWLAPEQIKMPVGGGRTMEKTTGSLLPTSVDIFALGCLFFCVLTSGQHPFGSPSYFRDQRALAGNYELAPLVQQMPVAAILIERMIQRDPDYRPSIQEVLAQSKFWSLDI